MSRPIRVAALDDDDRFRRQLVERLGYFPEIAVVLEARTAGELFRRLATAPELPDVVLVDVGLPDTSGVEVAARLAAGYGSVGILMLTVFEDPDTVLAAIQAGASGYLLKDASAQAIAQAIQEVAEGGVPLSRPVARKVLAILEHLPTAHPLSAASPHPSGDVLSPREVELLECIVQGDTEARIAEHLGISPHTVRTHVKNIYKKLQVGSRAAAVRLAYEQHLLDPRTSSGTAPDA